jgi:hypothetical protein
MRLAPMREIVNLVAFVTSPRFVREGDPLIRSRRLSASAGALHPIEVVVVDWRGTHRVMRYNVWKHQLEMLAVQNTLPIQNFIQKCVKLLPEASGTALVFTASLSTVAAVYENPTSLLWRDAGALLQMFAIASTAYRLAFCPLGILGNEVVQAIGTDERCIQSAGAAMVGRIWDDTC